MIAVVLVQIATRWGQAVTLLVLSMAVTVAAVSVPLYTVAVDRATVANELAAAESAELVVSLPWLRAGSSGTQPGAAEPPGGLPARPPRPPDDLPAFVEARKELAWFTPVTTVGIHVQGLGPDGLVPATHRLLARDGFCGHVTFRDGRCPVGSREVALPSGLADEAGVSPGDAMALTPVKPLGSGGWAPDGPPISITLTGVFEPAEPADPYWALQDPLGSQFFTPAIVTNRTTLRTLPHGQATVYVDAILPAGRLTPERIPALRRQLDAAEQRLAQHDTFSTGLTSRLPQLLDRIESHGDQARAFLPIAATPLILLGWLVVYIAVGHGVAGRRREVGAVALRGAKWRTRTMVVAAESVLPVLAGVPAGLTIAPLLVAAVGPAGVGRVALDAAQLRAAGLAAAGIIFAALIALRRELAAPIVQLLREVPPRRRRLGMAIMEVVAVALGIVAVADLWAFEGELVGVMVAAPVMVMLAVAVLAARVVRPLIDLAGRWSLRRGRLGPAMAAAHLARRPSVAWLSVILTLALGTVGLAATAIGVAAQGRVAEAGQALGAARVLEIQGVGRGELLQAVRAADPGGRYAMAVVSAPRSGAAPPLIAVDATRLAHVALWSERYGRLEPADVAELLRPPAPKPLLVSDGALVAEVSPAKYTADETLTVSLLLAPSTGRLVVAGFGPVANDQLTYRTEIAGCAAGCRLTGLAIATTGSEGGILGVTLHSLRQDGQDVIPLERLADTGWWRNPETGAFAEQVRVEAAADGLLLSASGPAQLLALDVPYPLPVINAGEPAGELLTSIDDQLIRVASQASLNGLPGVGSVGVLMDLEYAERLTAEPGRAASPQVWLAEDAPADITDQLRDQGLVVAGDRTIDDLQASIDQSGAAIALQFYGLVAGVAVLMGLGTLALVVSVDRRTWSRDLRALRAQGLAEHTTTGAAVWSYGGIVVAGAVAGVLAGTAAWLAAREQLPLGVDKSLRADWPQWAQILAPWTLAIAILLAAAVGGAWAVGRGGSRTGTKRGDNVPVTRGKQEVGN